MAQKYLYLIDYWVPFPSSEYGGLVAVIADSDTEAFEILSTNQNFDDRYIDRIMERVVNAQKYELSGDPKSGIQEAFTT